METTTAEQKARDMLERIGVSDAQSFSAGDLVESANLIDSSDALARDAGRYRKLRREQTKYMFDVKTFDHAVDDI